MRNHPNKGHAISVIECPFKAQSILRSVIGQSFPNLLYKNGEQFLVLGNERCVTRNQ